MVMTWVANSLDANARDLATCRRIRTADDLPLAGLIDHAVAGLKSIGRTRRSVDADGRLFFSGRDRVKLLRNV
jgi:hypothetical protein